MRKLSTRDVVAPLVLATVLFAGWWLTARFSGIPELLLPSPGTVVSRLGADLSGPTIWPYLGVTLVEALGGCLLGAAVAVPLAIATHLSRWWEAAVRPFLGATQAIPAIALAPLLVVWIGYGQLPVMVLCALMVFFPILIPAVVGLAHIDSSVIDAARVDGAGRWARLAHIEAPLALPHILSGLRNGFTLSITGAVVGEMVMGGNGMGTILTLEREAADTAGMFATLIILCSIAAAIYSLIQLAERRLSLVDTPVRP